MSNFPFTEIAVKALKFTWQHKWVWLFGFFLVGPFGTDVFSIAAERWSANQSLAPAWRSLLEQAAANPVLTTGAIIIFLLGVALFLFLNGLSEPAVIRSAVEPTESMQKSWRKLIAESLPYVKRIVVLRLANIFVFALVATLLAAPVYYLYNQGSEANASYLLLVAVAIFLPFVVFVSFVMAFAGNFVALANLKIKQALRAGLDMASRFWILAVVQAALIALIYFIASAVFALAVTLGGLFFRGLIFLADNSLNITLDQFSNIAGAILLGLLSFVFAAMASVWQTAVWTYTWQELVKMKKEKEAKKAEPAVEARL